VLQIDFLKTKKNLLKIIVQRRRLSLLRINEIDLAGNLPVADQARQIWRENPAASR